MTTQANVEQNKLPTSAVLPIVLALLVAIFAFQLNASMLSPALATMERELNATTAEIGLTQTAFFTAAALFSLFLPRWGDLIGRRKVLIGMLAITAIGCAISAMAPSVTVLFIGRVIQGVAGPIVPMSLIMLRVEVPNERQYALLMAVLTSINGGIAGVDALAGGWLAANYGFRSIFWVMAVVCAIAVFSVLFFIRESTAEETHPMDWKGVIPLVVALGSTLVALNEAGKLGAANWLLVGALLVVGAIGFVVFWNVEKRVAHPLVSTTYMKQRRTWALLLTTTLTMTGVFAVMNGLIPNLAQDSTVGAGLSADTVSWVTLTPYAFAGLLMGPVAGKLAGRLGYNRVLQIGLIGTAIGLGITMLAANFPHQLLFLFISIFVGITYAGMSNIMLNGLGIVLSPKDNPGYLPGMNSGAFNLGAGLSFAVLFAASTLFTDVAGARAGYMGGIATGAVILVLAFLSSLLIPKPAELDAKEANQP
ncbi:MAG TPA: MFS transporter [Propioniciclava sp.]|jgi:MFS family permease|uniref:uridine transporter UriT n=1 Tax=unclassified Propioniciclava TaxID=2642922 RepID=UPI001600AA18|nr:MULTISPECIES: MFS transporter [unclassified Propioniciclava]MBB1496405.1 MFS transporter [Propioniciclava sp. MC1595]MBB1503016.1 MFS transporter [Propioniciclava sp. MC1683]QTE27301.1 MFS transporter [Propioniciclava sp. MC1595]HRL50345.1 MFS transporter [Propioniciclava sp.]